MRLCVTTIHINNFASKWQNYATYFVGPHVANEEQSIHNSTSMTAGMAGDLTCIASGRPASNITWLYSSFINAATSVTYGGSPLITVTSVLTIHNPTQSMDGQQITCIISNQFSFTINRTTILDVNCESVILNVLACMQVLLLCILTVVLS